MEEPPKRGTVAKDAEATTADGATADGTRNEDTSVEPTADERPVLVLASASSARLETLRRAGIEPVVQVSEVDEDATLAAAVDRYGPLAPADAALLLARAKAEAVAASCGAEAVVLGCDSMLELDGEAHGKPADLTQARDRWQRMRGGSGVLHSGHWVVDTRPHGSGATAGVTSSTTVHFADITDAELEAYLATGEPLRVAGAFTTDGLGGAFIRGIEGDHHTVVGLSLPVLRDLLATCGVPWTTLWTTDLDRTIR
ncbi:MAG: Maf family nucleotide pyrophosphatase [Angustibacter sp.]